MKVKAIFFLILAGVGFYVGYTIISNDKILAPYFKKLVNNIEIKIGRKESVTYTKHCAIHFINPKHQEEVTSPVRLEVVVDNSQENCFWTVFEGQAGMIELYSQTGQLLGKAPLYTQGEWMTSSPVTYQSEIEYSGYMGPITVLLTDENPSGIGAPQRASLTLIGK
jgi:hypothetical protein